MNKLFLVGCFILGFLLLLPPSQTWAMDRYNLLSQARSAVSQGKQAEALDRYSEYITTHPAVTGRKTAAYKKNSQYYLRNLLIAISGQIEMQRALGRVQDVQKSLSHLRQIQQDNWFGSKNLHSLAELYKENGATAEALSCLNTIVSDQKRSPRKTNNKVFVRACKDLIEICRSLSMDQQVAEVMLVISSSLEQFDFDLKDRYQIGMILLEKGDKDAGQKVLSGIVHELNLENLTGEENAIVSSVVKLLELNAADREATSCLLATLDEFSEVYELTPRNQYSLGIACLNARQEKRGLQLLEKVKNSFPETTHARKALFVLGRAAASSSEWDKAIGYYTEYIDKYPEPRFFSLKAYSRLIDCYWARFKDPDLVDTEVHRLADIANDIADFETQLNLARDLKDKGYDGLAEATFDLALGDAQRRLQGDIDAEERLRILWLLQKYSFPLEKHSLVEEFAHETLSLLSAPANAKVNSSEKARFIKSQAYIWLAQTYQKTKRTDDAIKVYSDFLTEFQDSRDVNYVRFALGEIYEGKGNLDHAKGLYGKIDGGVWKDRARVKLNNQGRIQ